MRLSRRAKFSYADFPCQLVKLLVDRLVAKRMNVRQSIAVFGQRFEPIPLILAGVGTFPRMGDLRFSLL